MKPLPVLLLALLVTLLASCSSYIVYDWVAESGDPLYHDNFSDPASGWARLSGSTGAMDYYNTTYRIQVMIPDYDMWSVSRYEFGDVRVEVDAARFGGPVENRFGLICRYRDARNFYFFVISSDGYYAIGKADEGIHTLLGQEMMASSVAIVTGVAPNRLRFDCVGPTLTAYVNDQVVAATRDATFTQGNVGLLAGAFDAAEVDVIFDNFLVVKP